MRKWSVVVITLVACATHGRREPTLVELASELQCERGLEEVVSRSTPDTLQGDSLESFEPPAMQSAPVVAYPDQLREAGLEGVLVLAVMVSSQGAVEDAVVADSRIRRSMQVQGRQGRAPAVSQPLPLTQAEAKVLFEHVALKWVRTTTFRPGRINGQLVRLPACVPVVLSLEGR